jgi:hypothetical protein
MVLQNHPVELVGSCINCAGGCFDLVDGDLFREIEPCPAAEPSYVPVEGRMVQCPVIVKGEDPYRDGIDPVGYQEFRDIDLYRVRWEAGRWSMYDRRMRACTIRLTGGEY